MTAIEYRDPCNLLVYDDAPTARDKYETSCLDNLYLVLKKEGSFRNITEIVINTRIIYLNYMARRRGHIIREKEDENEYEAERDLIFVASAFLSVITWHTHQTCLEAPFWDAISMHPDIIVIFTPDKIYDYMAIITTTLNGHLINQALINIEENKHGLFHTLTLWFIGYRYYAFINPTYVRTALDIITVDIQSFDSVIETNATLHWDLHVRVVCQIIINHFKHQFKQEYVHDPLLCESPVLKRIIGLTYFDITKDEPCCQFNQEEQEEAGSDSEFLMNHNIRITDYTQFDCISIFSDKTSECGTVVYKGFSQVVDERYTIKRYATSRSVEHLFHFIKEVSILTLFRKFSRHICVACDIGVSNNRAYGYIFMNAHGVSLIDFLRHNYSHFRKDAMESIFHDMAMALSLCDQYDVVHNDIKPDNFIVEDGYVKLIDFGLSTAHFSYLSDHSDNVQSLPYRAPELLMGDRNYKHSIDIWALACTIHEVCTGEYLFYCKEYNKIPCKVLTMEMRVAQLCVIRQRCNDFIKKNWDEYLKTCPLWEERKKTKVKFNRQYNIINWLHVPIKLELIICRCLNFIPSQRPRAKDLLKDLKRQKSLF